MLVSRQILGYDLATVALIMGKKANAVKSLQFRALQSLECLLAKRAQPEKLLSHVQLPEEAR